MAKAMFHSRFLEILLLVGFAAVSQVRAQFADQHWTDSTGGSFNNPMSAFASTLIWNHINEQVMTNAVKGSQAGASSSLAGSGNQSNAGGRPVAAIRAQPPCTDAQARSWPGSLTLDRAAQAERNRVNRTVPDAAEQRKIDQAIALLTRSFPELSGVAGRYHYDLSQPGPTARSFHFALTAGFFDYYCSPSDGKIHLGDETGTWIYIYFNTLGWLVNEGASLGKELRTPAGETIFRMPRESGEWKGRPLYAPDLHQEPALAVLLTAPGKFPFKQVSRDDLLAAREAMEQKYLDDVRARLPSSSAVASRERAVQSLHGARAAMSPAEARAQAIVLNWSADPARGRLFTDDKTGYRLVAVDRTYMDRSLPPSAVQLIVLYWRIDGGPSAKHAAMEQFQSRFDLDALARLLDR